MPYLHSVVCSSCDFRQELPPFPAYGYRSAEVSFIHLRARTAWCQHCQRVTYAERLEPLERIEQAVVQEKNLRVRRDAERYQQLLSQRKSPPRCLDCGSTSLVLKSQDERHALYHPGCGGVLSFYDTGAHVLLNPMTHFYTFEGEFLETEETLHIPSKREKGPPAGSKLSRPTATEPEQAPV